jgi:superoxide dismutase, Cu-Zn family
MDRRARGIDAVRRRAAGGIGFATDSSMLRSILSVFVGIAGATMLFAAANDGGAPRVARVHLQNAKNASVGEAQLRETPNGVLLTADLHGLPPGEHGFHVHQTGKCEPPFESAGGHFNPTGAPHGFETDKGPHAGDMPNVFVQASGTAKLSVFLRGVTLDAGPNALIDADGAALVIHAGPDDYATDPAGNSGARIACGVIERPGPAAQSGARHPAS